MLKIEKAILRSFIMYTGFWAAVMFCYLSGMLEPSMIRLMFSTGFLLGFLKNLDRAMEEYVDAILHSSSA